MALVTNVFRRGGAFYFRARVPAALRPAVGRRELWRSLRTSVASVARRRGVTVLGLTETLWRDLERAMQSASKPVDPGVIKGLIDQWLRAEIEEDAYLRDAPEGERHVGLIMRRQPAWTADTVVQKLDHEALEQFQATAAKSQQALLGEGGYLLTEVSDLELAKSGQRKVFGDADHRHASEDETIAAKHVEGVFMRHGMRVDVFSPEFEVATRMMLRAHHDLLTVIRERDAVAWRRWLDDDPAADLLGRLKPSEAVPPTLEIAHTGPASGTTLTSACESCVQEILRTKGFSEGRAKEYRKAVQIFVGWFGREPDLSDVSPSVAGDFRTGMTLYPTNGGKRRDYRELTVKERIAKSQERGETDTLSTVTVNGKYLDPLRSVYEWAISAGKATSNPFAAIRVSSGKNAAPKRDRQSFSPQQLATLFGSSVFTGAASEAGAGLYQPGNTRVDDWRYWLPLMALFSGARLNELCGLRLVDFEQADGVDFFHVRAMGPDQKLKTEASKRIVPVHGALVELGLLSRVTKLRAAGADQLFPTIVAGARGYLSHTPSKFFGRLIDRVLGEEAPVVFHSFRHTFITKMREANVPREVRTALVGHDDDDAVSAETHEGYGSEPMARLNAGVQSVVFKGLDLSRIQLSGPDC